MIPSCTLVTANFYLSDEARTLEECYNQTVTLLELPCYLVIFTDQLMAERLRIKRAELGYEQLTKIVIMEKKELPTFHHRDLILANRERYWPTRDRRATWESHAICAAKGLLLQRIMDENPFSTKKFAWIDSHLGANGKKLSKNFSAEKFIQLLRETEKDPDHCLRMMMINAQDKKFYHPEHLEEFYRQYRWIVSGAFMVAGPETRDILQEHHDVFLDHLSQGYGHADEMFWFFLLEKYQERILRGYGDYSDTLDNFILPTSNHGYLLRLVGFFFRYGYEYEGRDLICKILYCQEHRIGAQIDQTTILQLKKIINPESTKI